MSQDFSYKNYVKDQAFLDAYNAYQVKYANNVRESDKIIIELVKNVVKEHGFERATRLLDVGCSTGNLLRHLKHMVPGMDLAGGDLAESSLEACRVDPNLKNVRFELMDLLNLPQDMSYDIVTVNAVLYMMEDEQFEAALKSLAGTLRSGGTMIVFDFFHPFPQDLHIIEVSKSHPKGLRLRFRPMATVRRMLMEAGFENEIFRPFTLPIELPPSGDEGDLITYTVPVQDGRRLPFRGTLFQPWCHLTATTTR